MNQPTLFQHLLEKSAEKFADKTALKHKEETVSFSELRDHAQAVVVALKDHGIKKGDRVGILLDKSIAQVVALLGILYGGGVFVIINSALHEKQIEHIINDCQMSLIISNSKFQKPLDKINAPDIIFEDQLQEMITANLGKTPEFATQSSDISTLIYTSGSTGMPKGIIITHKNLVEGAEIVSEYTKMTENDKVLGLLPLNFDYGLNQLTTSLLEGCTYVIFQYFLPNSLLDILSKEKITGLAAIPPIWASVFNPRLANLDFNKYDFSNLRYITNSGGKLPVPIVKQIRKNFAKTELYLMYGLTEAFRSTYLDPAEVDNRPESIGKAVPKVTVEVVDEDNNICPPGQEGELIHMGACIAQGYWNDPGKTAKVFRPNPLLPKDKQNQELVVYSGDLVKKDEQGFLYYIGRRDNMIKSLGYRVSPTEVEELLIQCPGVSDAVVFAKEDDEIGYRICAVVTTKSDVTENEILNHCKTEAPFYLVPKELYFVESFPKTASGKLDRPKIIKEYIS